MVHRYMLGTVPSAAESPLGAALSGVERTEPFLSSLVGALGRLALVLAINTYKVMSQCLSGPVRPPKRVPRRCPVVLPPGRRGHCCSPFYPVTLADRSA